MFVLVVVYQPNHKLQHSADARRPVSEAYEADGIKDHPGGLDGSLHKSWRHGTFQDSRICGMLFLITIHYNYELDSNFLGMEGNKLDLAGLCGVLEFYESIFSGLLVKITEY